MCLSSVAKGAIKYRTRVGYKVMRRVTNWDGTHKYTGPYFGCHRMILGHMYTAEVSVNKENKHNQYLNGFHIFKKKLDAKQWGATTFRGDCLVKVYYRRFCQRQAGR